MRGAERRVTIGVIGASQATPSDMELAVEVGRLIARSGATLVCGGLGGVMEGCAKGAREEGGLTVGILPGTSTRDANEYIMVPIATGMGEARNVIIVRSSDCLIAIGGGYGTLSEIATAMRLGVDVIGLGTWRVQGVEPDIVRRVGTAGEAVEKAIEIARAK
ncbi:MAG: TIGR00725 family protein [Candidatus Glassbacteria bacterium]